MSRRSFRRAFQGPIALGSLTMGVGVAVYGLTAYGFLIVSARALGPTRYASLSVLWSLIYLLAPGFFLPVEQELSRALASSGERDGSYPRRLQTAALGLSVALVVLVVSSGRVLTDRLFDGQVLLLVSLAFGISTYAVQHVVRGYLAGTGQFRSYALVLSTEGLLRLISALALAALGVAAAGPYGFIIAMAPLLSLIPTVGDLRTAMGNGPADGWLAVVRALTFLLMSSLLAQFLAIAGPIVVKLLATAEEQPLAGRLLASLVLTRVPLFLLQAVQPPLLSRLSTLAGSGRMDEFRSSSRRIALTVAALGAATIVVMVLIGPSLVGALFGNAFALGRLHVGLLAGGSAAYVLAVVLVQALIALRAQVWVAAGWLIGSVVFVVVTALHSGLLARVEYGFLFGSVAAAATMGIALFQVRRPALGDREQPPIPVLVEP